MKIIYKKGNLITASEKNIIHGCNNRGVMGSGVAREIRREFPEAYYAYKNSYKDFGLELGEIIWAYENKWIGNCITQNGYGKDGKKYVCYNAIRKCIREINHCHYLKEELHDNELMQVAMPLIGAGLGGGDWNIISKIIEEESIKFQPIVYKL